MPPISLPKPTVNFDFAFLNASDSSISRIETGVTLLLGISTPTAALPGTGATRTVDTAKLSAISSASPTILESLTPVSG